MKLLRVNKASFVFQLSVREKTVLTETVKLYPLVPPGHFRLTKAAPQSEENQQLLEEALAEQRGENRRQVEAMLGAPARWRPHDPDFHFTLKTSELEWLLQVLNDIRVGCWLKLGEPDESNPPQISAENLRYYVAMEVCGAFESLLLAAGGETESSDWTS